MLHYTNKKGFNAIRSQKTWRFKAHKPPGPHPFGVYFTNLPPDADDLAARLQIPASKLKFVFRFDGSHGLMPLPGGRGKHVFWTPVDYTVMQDRQLYHGESEGMS